MASIRDVAKLANVSPATVSRVMNNTANVDEEKRERVLCAIKETGFVPNQVARSLYKKSAMLIGLIVPSIENPFFTQMANAIEKSADAMGYRLLLCSSADDVEKEKTMISMLTSMNADGIIITTSNDELIPYINNSTIPIVVTDRQLEESINCDYVHCDHYKSGRMAMEHLLECGCKNIVCIRASQYISSARARYEGYADVCKERGIAQQIIDTEYSFEKGLEVTEKLLEIYPKVDGIIACNDMVAISVYKILNRHKIKVPQDVKLIGFDDIYISRLMTPEITTIGQPIHEMGKKAVELIVNEHKSAKREYIFEPSLIIRETTR